MTIQEKIDQLAAAALRSAPTSRKPPTPTTYMAPFEKPRFVALVGQVPAADGGKDRSGALAPREGGSAKA
jgi:hypothetical protein